MLLSDLFRAISVHLNGNERLRGDEYGGALRCERKCEYVKLFQASRGVAYGIVNPRNLKVSIMFPNTKRKRSLQDGEVGVGGLLAVPFHNIDGLGN